MSKIPPKNQFEYELRGPCQALKSGAGVDKQAKLGEHWVLSFCRNLSGQRLIKLQYDTVVIFVIAVTGVVSKLNRMVPAEQ